MVLDTESITKHVDDHEEVISRPNTRRLSEEETHTYVEKGATDILQQDQQLECVSEEEISTTVHEGMGFIFIRCFENTEKYWR